MSIYRCGALGHVEILPFVFLNRTSPRAMPRDLRMAVGGAGLCDQHSLDLEVIVSIQRLTTLAVI
jgi:hypothetical protein